MTPISETHNPSAAGRRIETRRLVPILLAAGLGIVLVYAAGFAHSSILHNAAHDVRHSSAFPCH